jgi:hypothetical protein
VSPSDSDLSPSSGESFGSELADRLQHPEAITRVTKKALLDERLKDVEVGVAHGLRRVQGAAAGEHRQSSEEPLLIVGEQVV